MNKRILPLLTILFFIVAGCGSHVAAPASPPVNVQEKPIPAQQVVEEYNDNRTAATAKYHGRSVLIQGTVNRINQFLGSYNLYLLEPTKDSGLVTWLADNTDITPVTVGAQVILVCDVQGDADVFQNCLIRSTTAASLELVPAPDSVLTSGIPHRTLRKDTEENR